MTDYLVRRGTALQRVVRATNREIICWHMLYNVKEWRAFLDSAYGQDDVNREPEWRGVPLDQSRQSLYDRILHHPRMSPAELLRRIDSTRNDGPMKRRLCIEALDNSLDLSHVRLVNTTFTQRGKHRKPQLSFDVVPQNIGSMMTIYDDHDVNEMVQNKGQAVPLYFTSTATSSSSLLSSDNNYYNEDNTKNKKKHRKPAGAIDGHIDDNDGDGLKFLMRYDNNENETDTSDNETAMLIRIQRRRRQQQSYWVVP